MATNRSDIPWQDWGQLPTIQPPRGITPNFVNPVSLQCYDVLTQTVCLIVTTLLICMRLWTKGIVLNNIGWDDWTSFFAWLGLVVNAILNLEEDRFGSGRHLWDVKGDDFTEYAKLINVSQIIYGPIIFIVRLSIVLQFLHVFAPRRTICILLYILIGLNLLFYTAGVIVEIFQCKPREKIWLPLVPGTCINERTAQFTAAVFNTVSDFALLIIPIATVMSLKLTPKKKYGLVAIFATGLLGCIASLVRVVVIIQKSRHVILDGTWEWYSLNLWSTAEMACGIVCGCLPPMPAFIRYLRGRPPLSQATSSSREQVSNPEKSRIFDVKCVGRQGQWTELNALD